MNAAEFVQQLAKAELARREQAAKREEEMLREWADKLTLEDVFVRYASIQASPLQLAICRAADGRPLDGVLSDRELREYFGVTSEEALSHIDPTIVELVCGVRGGKTFLSACGAIRGAIRARCSHLQPHEMPRCPIIAPNVDNAKQTFDVLKGILEGSEVLSNLIVHKTANTITIRRPDGRRIQFVVVAANRGGIALRSRWLAGAVFEEVAFFPSDIDGKVVNAEELLRAAETRLLPNTQAWLVSSPNGPQGLLYELHRQYWGQPGRFLVVQAPTRALNPTFPKESIEALRKRDPDAAARDHDAAWISAVSSFLDAATVDGCRRLEPIELEPREDATYTASMDPATRGNAYTLVLVETIEDMHRVALTRQWQGSRAAPLSPKGVLIEMAGVLRPYNVREVLTDQWSIDAIRDLAEDEEVQLDIVEVTQTSASKWDAMQGMKTLLLEKRLDCGPEPLMRADLLALKKTVTPSGPKVEAPKTANGRHADFASCLAVCSTRLSDPPVDDDHIRAFPQQTDVDTLAT